MGYASKSQSGSDKKTTKPVEKYADLSEEARNRMIFLDDRIKENQQEVRDSQRFLRNEKVKEAREHIKGVMEAAKEQIEMDKAEKERIKDWEKKTDQTVLDSLNKQVNLAVKEKKERERPDNYEPEYMKHKSLGKDSNGNRVDQVVDTGDLIVRPKRLPKDPEFATDWGMRQRQEGNAPFKTKPSYSLPRKKGYPNYTQIPELEIEPTRVDGWTGGTAKSMANAKAINEYHMERPNVIATFKLKNKTLTPEEQEELKKRYNVRSTHEILSTTENTVTVYVGDVDKKNINRQAWEAQNRLNQQLTHTLK